MLVIGLIYAAFTKSARELKINNLLELCESESGKYREKLSSCLLLEN